jgi:hypothetical protein
MKFGAITSVPFSRSLFPSFVAAKFPAYRGRSRATGEYALAEIANNIINLGNRRITVMSWIVCRIVLCRVTRYTSLQPPFGIGSHGTPR